MIYRFCNESINSYTNVSIDSYTTCCTTPKHCDESGTSVNYTLKIPCLATFKHLPCNCKLSTIMCSHLEHADDPDPHLLKHKWQVLVWHFWDVRIAVVGWINKPNTGWDCHPWSRFWSSEGGLRNGWPLGQAPDVVLFFKSLRVGWFPDHFVWRQN